jgi:hypothetical protein
MVGGSIGWAIAIAAAFDGRGDYLEYIETGKRMRVER